MRVPIFMMRVNMQLFKHVHVCIDMCIPQNVCIDMYIPIDMYKHAYIYIHDVYKHATV